MSLDPDAIRALAGARAPASLRVVVGSDGFPGASGGNATKGTTFRLAGDALEIALPAMSAAWLAN
jgi:hypothetical protein